MTKIKTELEQKIELMDSLENVKNVVNGAGGNITEDTPYLQYGEKVLEVIGGGSSRKGSFDSTTQQLTLNYDYLVEKINSSTMLTDAQKTTAISELNNSDVVVSMTTSMVPENEYIYAFQASTQVGLFVDVATPVTLKTVIAANDPSAVISSIGTYKAIADFNTFMGSTMTEEEAEAQYAPFIVDENLCTVSGTLGNFSVEFN